MKFSMTQTTKGDNIKPMFLCITGMMVTSRLLSTKAFQSIGLRQFAFTDSVIYGIVRFYLFGVSAAIFLLVPLLSLFVFFASDILLSGYFAFFSFIIAFYASVNTDFAPTMKAVLRCPIFVKFCNGLAVLAVITFFCYNLLRHNQFLSNWLCLGPVSRPILVSGSFYNNKLNVEVN